MKNIIHKKSLAGFFFLFCLFAETAFPQEDRLYHIGVTQKEEAVRVTIACSRPLRYTYLTKDYPYRLMVYIKDALLDLPEDEINLSKGPITRIKASQWLKEPLVAKIDIEFGEKVDYEISADSGKIYVDVEEIKISPISSPSKPKAKPKGDDSQTGRINQLKSQVPITMDFREAEITNVLRLLARQNNVNIVASKDVTGKITLSLSNVSLEEALDNILKANGYIYVVDRGVILVKPMDKFQPGEMTTRVYHLKYIDASNLKEAIADVISAQAKVRVFSGSFHSRDQKEGKQEKTKERSSTLIVTDFPENLQQVEDIVQALDVSVPQIMIEAKLIELAPTKEGKLGIDWTKTISATVFYEKVLPSGNILSYSAMSDLPIENGGLTYGKLSASQFTAVLDFLRSETDSKLISNPRIIAMDNQESEISVGTTFPVPQINRGMAGQGDIVTFEYKDVDISLKVTPHISEDRNITMFVNPIIEEVTGEVVFDKNRAPITSKRSVETVVKVKDGETIVIGGLIRENNTETVKKIWLLGDIPLIGNLFRHKEIEKKQTDLLIFITPHIIEGA